MSIISTIFDTLDKTKNLIAIASRPNIHPQAVLAAEQLRVPRGSLGAALDASAARIAEAQNELDVNSSVRIEAIQAHVGLQSRDLHKVMRSSTGLLQFFLVITACKPCFLDSELGALAFSMCDESGVLKGYPVSSEQLQAFVQHFSAHSEALVPMEMMHEIAGEVAATDPGSGGLYGRLGIETLAELLVRVLEKFRDEEITEIVLRGRTHGVLIATVFSWLLPDRSCVMVGQNIVRGSPGAKLTVQLVQREERWNLEVFKNEQNLPPYVFDYDLDEEDANYLRRLPINQARQYFGDSYCSTIEDRKDRQRAVGVLGKLTRILTIFCIEHGTLFTDKPCCNQKKSRCQTVPFCNLLGNDRLQTYNEELADYGWDSGDDSVFRDNLRTDSEALLETLRRHGQDFRQSNSPEEALKLLKSICSDWFSTIMGGSYPEVSEIMIDPALYIALDNFLTSTVQGSHSLSISTRRAPTSVTASTSELVLRESGGELTESGRQTRRYFSPMSASRYNDIDEVVGDLLRTGISVTRFRQLAFAHLLPGVEMIDPQDLVVSYGGYTAGMEVLRKLSTQQNEVLVIRYTRGGIEKDGKPMSRVRESKLSSTAAYFAFSPLRAELFDNQANIYSEPSPPEGSKFESASFDTSTSIRGDKLIVKHYMMGPTILQFSSQPHEKLPSSWTSAVDMLATATHAGRGQELTVPQERLLAKRLHEAGVQDQMACFSGLPELKRGGYCKALLTPSGNGKLRFFSASWAAGEKVAPGRCFNLVVRHNAALLRCIAEAERVTQNPGKLWVMIS